MPRYFFLLFLLLTSLVSLPAFSVTLSESTEISVITCSNTYQVHTVYGHTAIRVNDPAQKIDHVFNYGVFSFDAPNFVYRFAKGETDYMLYAYPFNRFLQSYKEEGRSVYEQVLNLTVQEKQQLFDFLVWNAQEENRVYRYNFFFDNCASRVRDVVEKKSGAKITFPSESEHPQTFRELIKSYHRPMKWLDFGVDLVVSAPADRIATAYEEMFLPDYLMAHFAKASIEDESGKRALVSHTRTLYEAPKLVYKEFFLTSPFLVFMIICLLVYSISRKQLFGRKLMPCMDYLIYGLTGILGFTMLWFVLYSEHPAMRPNYNLIWAMPLNLIFALAWTVKRWRPITRYYHVFMTGWLILFALLYGLIPQKFHFEVLFFVLLVLNRSILNSWMIFRPSAK